MGFPGGASVKEATCQCRRCKGSIPGSEISLGVGNGTALQYCRLENSMGRGAWWATIHEATKSQIMTEQLSTQRRQVNRGLLLGPSESKETPGDK